MDWNIEYILCKCIHNCVIQLWIGILNIYCATAYTIVWFSYGLEYWLYIVQMHTQLCDSVMDWNTDYILCKCIHNCVIQLWIGILIIYYANAYTIVWFSYRLEYWLYIVQLHTQLCDLVIDWNTDYILCNCICPGNVQLRPALFWATAHTTGVSSYRLWQLHTQQEYPATGCDSSTHNRSIQLQAVTAAHTTGVSSYRLWQIWSSSTHSSNGLPWTAVTFVLCMQM